MIGSSDVVVSSVVPVVSSVVVSVVSSVYARASVATSDERKRVLSILEFMFALSAKFFLSFN